MSRPQQGLVGVDCALGLLSATCATRTAPPAPLPFPEPVAATDARVPYVPGPTRIDDGPTGPPEVRGGATAAAEGGDLTVADAPSASSVDGTTSPDVELPERDVDQLPDLEIPMNAKVTTFVDLFSRRLKGDLEDGLGRGAQYLPMIREVFRAEGLPLDLAYVPLIESAFKPSALSRARAKGIWQFMEGTALKNGLQSDWYIDERAEPEKATRAAAKYLRTLYGMFDDWHLALAAYNGGPGRVRRAMRSSGRADFWSLSESTRYLPRETRDYVPLILASVVVARDPAAYDIAVVERGDTLYALARLYGTTVRALQTWNRIAGSAIQVGQRLTLFPNGTAGVN